MFIIGVDHIQRFTVQRNGGFIDNIFESSTSIFPNLHWLWF